jgi:hypothetical protein
MSPKWVSGEDSNVRTSLIGFLADDAAGADFLTLLLADLCRDLDPSSTSALPTPMAAATAIYDWLKFAQNLAQKTVRRYQGDQGSIYIFFLGQRPLVPFPHPRPSIIGVDIMITIFGEFWKLSFWFFCMFKINVDWSNWHEKFLLCMVIILSKHRYMYI